MGKVIPFPSGGKTERRDKEVEGDALRLMKIADDIDSLILKHLEDGSIDPHDIAGLLAHRLGTLMRHLDEKSKLWDVCERVLKKQAAID